MSYLRFLGFGSSPLKNSDEDVPKCDLPGLLPSLRGLDYEHVKYDERKGKRDHGRLGKGGTGKANYCTFVVPLEVANQAPEGEMRRQQVRLAAATSDASSKGGDVHSVRTVSIRMISVNDEKATASATREASRRGMRSASTRSLFAPCDWQPWQ